MDPPLGGAIGQYRSVLLAEVLKDYFYLIFLLNDSLSLLI